MDYKQQTYSKVRKGRARYARPRPYPNTSNRPQNAAPQGTQGQVTTSGFAIKGMPFFGYRITKTLPYYAAATITSGASTASAYVFSANGVYDPDITGTGGQPMSFDQAMTFYNHYTVHGARIRVVFMSNSGVLRASVGLFVSGSSTVTTSVEQLLENGDGAFQVLEYAGAFGGTATFSRSLNVGKFQAVKDVMDDPDMRGDAASNPIEQSYFHLCVWNPASAAVVSVDFQAFIEYDTTFHEPRKGSLS